MIAVGRGKLNHASIARVRLIFWQPQYPPVRRLAAGLVKSKRAKKRLVVQAARRLAIDLWRLSTGQTTPEKGSNGARLSLGLGQKLPRLRLNRSLLSLICSLHKSPC